MSIIQKFNDYTPTKAALAWTAVGASALTMVVGFTWGGWVTGGSAQEMAEDAADTSRAELAASICVDNFRTAESARALYGELTELSSFRQRQFIEDADWALLPSGDGLDRQSAALCAERIAEIDPDSLPNPMTATADEAAETNGDEPVTTVQ